MVSGGNDDAFGARLIEKDEEGIKNSPGLPHIVARSLGTESIELIEEVDRPLVPDGIKHNSQLACRLTKELTQEAVQSNGKQR